MGRSDCEKNKFCNKIAREWDLQIPGETALGQVDIDNYFGRRIDGIEGVRVELEIGERNVEERKLLEFCDVKKLSVVNTWCEKKERRKITYSVNKNKTEIGFVLVSKNNIKYLKDVKAILQNCSIGWW